MIKLLTILVLITLIISFFQITSMYALYKEQLQGEYNTLLGAWQIKVNEKDVTTSGQIENFTITDDQLGYVASQAIQAGKIAPGGKAYFDIIIDPTNTDVSIKYQINMESIDIPNVQIKLLEIENCFKKDGEADTINENFNLTGNLYTAMIPIEKINQGYKNYLRLNFEWVNVEDNNITDSALANIIDSSSENIIWTSNNDNVATISNGKITAISEGVAIITVKTIDGNYTDTCTVTVTNQNTIDEVDENEENIVQVAGIELDKSNVTLKIGETESLKYTIWRENSKIAIPLEINLKQYTGEVISNGS